MEHFWEYVLIDSPASQASDYNYYSFLYADAYEITKMISLHLFRELLAKNTIEHPDSMFQHRFFSHMTSKPSATSSSLSCSLNPSSQSLCPFR